MRAPLAGLGVTLLALACCAAAPLLVGTVGGLTLLWLAGVGAALVLAVVLTIVLTLLRRRRRTCQGEGALGRLLAREVGRPMRVELLYFDGCPSHEALLPRLRVLLESADGAQKSVEGRATGRRRGRPRKGEPTQADQFLALVKEQPGIKISEAAKGMSVQPSSLYRVVSQLEGQGAVERRDRAIYPREYAGSTSG